MTRQPFAAVLAAALLATGATACTPSRGKPKVVVETRTLDRLGAAITGLNAARKRIADDAAALAAAAAALDDVDAIAVTGDRAKVRAARPAATNAVARARPAARRMTANIKAYDAAVAALAAANGAGLDEAQQRAVADVVTAGRAESPELHAYGGVVATVWPRYEKLDENQTLWLARASNGWYRDQHESAGAYTILTDRPALDAGRRSFATADRARLDAAKPTAASIAAARAALASLLG